MALSYASLMIAIISNGNLNDSPRFISCDEIPRKSYQAEAVGYIQDSTKRAFEIPVPNFFWLLPCDAPAANLVSRIYGGSTKPERAFTAEISDELIAPEAFTSNLKLVAFVV